MANIQVKVYRSDAINSPHVERYVAVSSFGGNNVYGYGNTPEEAVEKWLEQVKKNSLITKEVVKDGKGFAINMP